MAEVAQTSYRIMVFSWNTESINLCETLDADRMNYNRSGWNLFGMTATKWQYKCEIPDFYPKLAEFIIQNTPDIIVIGFQEDRYPGSYFHSHLLPEEMTKIGYGLVKRTKLMGVGVTTYKNSLKGDPHERGLRVSVYAKSHLIPLIEKEEKEMRIAIGDDGQEEYLCSSSLTRGKGATVSYLMLPGFGRLAFICCHLPFNARSLILERQHKNKMLRQNELNESNVCFNNIIESLVLFKTPMPTHVIYFGDFNYRMGDHRPASKVADLFNDNFENPGFINDLYKEYDELREQMRRKNIYDFLEGVNNQGPTFVPTCKMVKGRITSTCYDKENNEGIQAFEGTDCWKTGKQDQRVPSWCDRILYQKFGDDNHNLICTYYNRFDVGDVMSKSDHAGVLSMFELI